MKNSFIKSVFVVLFVVALFFSCEEKPEPKSEPEPELVTYSLSLDENIEIVSPENLDLNKIAENEELLLKIAIKDSCEAFEDLYDNNTPLNIKEFNYKLEEGKIFVEKAFTMDKSYNLSVKYSDNLKIPPANKYETITDGVKLKSGDYSGDILIPNFVTSLGESAFEDCSSLSSVVIPDSVQSIEDDAFRNCSSLSSVVIPDSVQSIEYSAFRNCSSLISVVIPDSVTSIESYAFSDCSSLSSVVIPDSVTSIESYAFSDCSSLSSVVIPESVTSIGGDSFLETPFLENLLSSGSGLAIVNNMLFAADKSITTANIPSGVVKIEAAFVNCEHLSSVVIPDSVQTIGDFAFRGCRNLNSINIPDGLTSIGDYAFYECRSLEDIYIPLSVENIGFYAFRGCLNLTIRCEASSKPDGWYEDWNPTNRPVEWGAPRTYTLTLDDNISVVSPSGLDLSRIPENTELLLKIDIKESCEAFESLNDNTTPLNVEGFNYKLEAGEIFVEKEFTMDKSYNLSVKYSETLKIPPVSQYEAITDGVKLNSGTYSGDILIPNFVTSIEDSAFDDCSSLSSVVIPDSVTSIGEGVFLGCSSLSSVVIPESVTSIGGSSFLETPFLENLLSSGSGLAIVNNILFYADKSLTTADIPSGVVKIEAAFVSCEHLSSVVIPDSVQTIGDYAFRGCRNLNSINIPDGLTSIGDQAFYECVLLNNINIPDGLTSIGDQAFYDCSSLDSINIPDNVQSIGQRAFAFCSSLEEIYIPLSVETIGDIAFRGCPNLTIKCEASSKPDGWADDWNSDNRPVEWGASE